MNQKHAQSAIAMAPPYLHAYVRHTGVGFSSVHRILPSISMVDSVSCLRYAQCSRAPDYITNGYGSPMHY